MPDSYRLKPHGGPRSGNGAGPGFAMAFTTTRPSAEPAVPPTLPQLRKGQREESRDREDGRLPEGGDERPKASTSCACGDVAGPPRNAAPSRIMRAMGVRCPRT